MKSTPVSITRDHVPRRTDQCNLHTHVIANKNTSPVKKTFHILFSCRIPTFVSILQIFDVQLVSFPLPPPVRPHQWFSAQAAGVAGGALDALEHEDESSDGGGGVATAQPGRRRSTLSESLWQRAAAEGPAAAETVAAKVWNCCWSISYLHYCCCFSTEEMAK